MHSPLATGHVFFADSYRNSGVGAERKADEFDECLVNELRQSCCDCSQIARVHSKPRRKPVKGCPQAHAQHSFGVESS